MLLPLCFDGGPSNSSSTGFFSPFGSQDRIACVDVSSEDWVCVILRIVSMEFPRLYCLSLPLLFIYKFYLYQWLTKPNNSMFNWNLGNSFWFFVDSDESPWIIYHAEDLLRCAAGLVISGLRQNLIGEEDRSSSLKQLYSTTTQPQPLLTTVFNHIEQTIWNCLYGWRRTWSINRWLAKNRKIHHNDNSFPRGPT